VTEEQEVIEELDLEEAVTELEAPAGGADPAPAASPLGLFTK
jgi:hypothetical protein